MEKQNDPEDPDALTATERDFVRREFGMFFGAPFPLSEGVMLKVWKTGPQKGSDKIPPVIQGLIDRGLMLIRRDGHARKKAFFTDRGLEAVRHLLANNRRYFDPVRHRHLWDELAVPFPE